MSRKPDGSRANVEVHQIVYNAALQVVLYAVDDDLAANVQDLEIGVVTLVAVSVNGLVDLLVVLDAVPEVERSLFGILSFVVGTRGLDVPDVCHDEVLVVALGLNEQNLDTLTCAGIGDPFAALFRRVCRIQDSNDTALLEPCQHVCDGGLCSGFPPALPFCVAHIKEVGGWLRRIGPAVVTHVERLGVDGEPLEVTLSWSRDMLANSNREICEQVGSYLFVL